jgi:hypothetical protein
MIATVGRPLDFRKYQLSSKLHRMLTEWLEGGGLVKLRRPEKSCGLFMGCGQGNLLNSITNNALRISDLSQRRIEIF